MDRAAAALVTTAINGGNLRDNLTTAIVNGLIDTGAAGVAQQIGASNVNALASAVSHAVAGCVAGAGRATAGGYGASASSGCSAGAIGAVVGELTASIYNPNRDPTLAADTVELSRVMAGLAGALVGGNQASTNIAAEAGANAAENNYMGRAGQLVAAAARLCAARPALCGGGVALAALQSELHQRAVAYMQANPERLRYDQALDLAVADRVASAVVYGAIGAWNGAMEFIGLTNPPPTGTPGFPAAGPPQPPFVGGPVTAPDLGPNHTGGDQILDPPSGPNVAGGGYGAGGVPDYGGPTVTPIGAPQGPNYVVSTGSEPRAPEFEQSISRLPPNERVGVVRTTLGQIAAENGLTRDPRLTRINGRDVYVSPDGSYFAVDTQHGRFEMTNSRGQHLGEYNIDFQPIPNSRDTSGRHDLRVK